MESLGLYLLKSAVWLTGFALVFLIVLRNERYFRLNRIYLLSGIVASILFPLYTWHYTVILPVQDTYITTSGITAVAGTPPPTVIPVYFWFYVVGIAGLAFRLIWQTGMVVHKLRKAGYVKTGSIKLVRTSDYAASFSFFSFVFVNPSIADIETKEIVNHEREHIQQKHWFDLLFVELFCMIQWFNPFVWIYARLIRQNHEYLADEMALQHTSNPAIYQATLLNQMFGAPVISLANSFNYSLNKKRFKMMKKKIDSPFRKLKMLFVLPFVAMVFYAFAEPAYITSEPVLSTDKKTTVVEVLNELKVPVALPVDKSDKVIQVEKDKIVKGQVVNTDGKPLPGTTVIILGSTVGVITDRDGNFKLKDVPKNGELVFSFVGYETAKEKPDFEKPMVVKMAKQNVGLDGVVVVGYGIVKESTVLKVVDSKRAQQTVVGYDIDKASTPPPPTSTGVTFVSPGFSKNPPLIFLDGIIIDKANMDVINHDNIKSITVLKDANATGKYGDKGNNGVIEIYSKVPFTGFAAPDSTLNHIKFRSVNFDNPPLYVLDGVIIDKVKMDVINPNDIESISVLKNGSATALYGEKAKNGLILIVSKKKMGAATNKNLNNTGVVGNTDLQKKDKEVFIVVEQMPEFPGGDQAARKFIAQQIKYPMEALKGGINGKVVVTFVVNSNGKVENAKIARGIDPALDAEAIRVVNSMPDWKPGKQRGQAVDVAYTMPIEFTLQ